MQVRAVDPTGPEAGAVLRRAMHDLASSWYGRPATDAEVDAGLRDAPSDDLLLLIAELDGEAVGCAGLRLLGDVAELKRVFVAPGARGCGVGTLLVVELERRARDAGASVLRLDTRRDLLAARRLYARLGFVEVEPFNDEEYAHHWLAKQL